MLSRLTFLGLATHVNLRAAAGDSVPSSPELSLAALRFTDALGPASSASEVSSSMLSSSPTSPACRTRPCEKASKCVNTGKFLVLTLAPPRFTEALGPASPASGDASSSMLSSSPTSPVCRTRPNDHESTRESPLPFEQCGASSRHICAHGRSSSSASRLTHPQPSITLHRRTRAHEWAHQHRRTFLHTHRERAIYIHVWPSIGLTDHLHGL